MTNNSVSDFTCLINQAINLSENITVCLSKMQALVTLTLNSDFNDLQPLITQEYFFILNDYIIQAIQFNDKELNTLIKHNNLNVNVKV